jgi:O-antigen/teichoic acid export membrane protein
LVVLAWGARQYLRPPYRFSLNGGTLRGMVGDSFPLMLNNFLATVFFQIDVVILQPYQGDRVVGQYSTAYKWLQAINVIPSFFTQALMPLMSRQAQDNPDALRRTYGLAIKLLLWIAFPAAVFFTFSAEFLTVLLGGAEYLPGGAIALQIMIWSVPIGWMNSLTQYVLIALNLQRRITGAFVIAVSFNIISNLIFVPIFSYQASAVITILSEAALWIAFGVLLSRAMGWLNWAALIARPALAAGVMAAVTAALWSVQPFLALVVGSAIYAVVLLATRPLDADEWTRLVPLLPQRVQAFVNR